MLMPDRYTGALFRSSAAHAAEQCLALNSLSSLSSFPNTEENSFAKVASNSLELPTQGKLGPNPNVHVLGKCTYWQEWRHQFMSAAMLREDVQPERIAMAILTVDPESVCFPIAVRMCYQIDKELS